MSHVQLSIRYLGSIEKGVAPCQPWSVDITANLAPDSPGEGKEVTVTVDPFSKWVEFRCPGGNSG